MGARGGYSGIGRRLVFVLLLGLLMIPGGAALANQNASGFPRIDTQTYGDFSFRDTNFRAGGYHAITGWWETRFILRAKEKVAPQHRYMVFEPYVKFTQAASEKRFSWENNLVYGLGFENRFLAALEGESSASRDWAFRLKELASRLRLYFEYLDMAPVKDHADPWVSQHDVRIGVDLWKEWNVPPDAEKYANNLLWGELWLNAGWRKTNFNLPDYKTHNNGLMGRLGLRHDKPVCLSDSGVQALALPYLMVETGYTGKDYFWENQLNVGGGFRLMFTLPVAKEGKGLCDSPKMVSESKPIIVRLYAEALHTVDHYRGVPDPGTPDNDFRVGVNFSYNLF